MARWTVFVTWLALASGASGLFAQQLPAGRAVAELEKAVVETVAKTEASVVAIARVRKEARDRSGEWFDVAPGRFAVPGTPSTTDPDSPDFTPQEYATGVVIDRNGLIVTTHSVLGDIPKNDYYVWSQRRRWQAQVMAADPWLDLAVLKVDANDLQPIKFGDAKTLQKGQFVIALGNPYGIAKDGDVSARWGIVANLNRSAALPRPRSNASADTIYQLGNLIETDALLERGTAGGPLLNLDGEMIGLTTSYVAEAYAERGGNLAIPVDQAFTGALEKLKTGRKAEYGFLGIAPLKVAGDSAPGVVVGAIAPGTPAEAAALRSSDDSSMGDRVTHVDDIEVVDANHLIVLLGRLQAQSVVQLTLLRYDGNPLQPPRKLKQQIVLAKKHIASMRPAYATVVDPPWRGATIDFATAMPGMELRFGAPRDCVAVLEIDRDSPVWKAGLRPGSYISHVDDQPVRTPDEFRAAVEGKMAAVTLRVREEFTGEREIQVPAP